MLQNSFKYFVAALTYVLLRGAVFTQTLPTPELRGSPSIFTTAPLGAVPSVPVGPEPTTYWLLASLVVYALIAMKRNSLFIKA